MSHVGLVPPVGLRGRTATAGVIAAALLLTSCSRDKAPTEPTAPATPSSAHGSLADCLQVHGVPSSAAGPAVLGPPDGVSQETWDTAMKACSELAPGPATP